MQVFKHMAINNIQLMHYPFPRELVMEAYLIDNPAILSLEISDLTEPEVIGDQIVLTKINKDRDGRIDLLVSYTADTDTYAIIELKKEEVNQVALNQLEDYLSDKKQLNNLIQKYYENDQTRKEIGNRSTYNWIGILVGTSISSEMATKLTKGHEKDGVPIGAIILNRYRDNDTKSIYVTSDTYFKLNANNRDYTKYQFNHHSYGKGRLVHAVVKHYVELHPMITRAPLKTQKNSLPSKAMMQ